VVEVKAAVKTRRGYGFLRGVSGILAVGMVLLALANIAVQFYANARDLPGPGVLSVTAHIVAAVLVIVGQIIADRFDDWRAPVSVLGVFLVSAATLWLFWWA
jgi:hypothetical protein